MSDETTEKREIRMFCDYSAEWPVWAEDGLTSPERLGLSPALAEKLRVWNEYFQANAHWDKNYLVSKESDALWAAEGRRLAEHLQRELGPDVTVVYRQG